jgi:hypothetical protein
MSRISASALWYVAPGKAELRAEALAPLKPGFSRIRARYSAISRGTEQLVFEGRVPQSEWQRMRAPHQAGDFPFPVKYGYAAVGLVEEGRHSGELVFALHPHQDLFDMSDDDLVAVPKGVPAQRAVLAANMETALNALWDGGVQPASRIAVIGAGAVGGLVAYLAGQVPGTDVTLVDVRPERASLSAELGVRFSSGDDAPEDCDLVVHASGSEAGLATALRCAGTEATIVELSWYGDAKVSLSLGQGFHARRLRLISSQVGQIAPVQRPRWDYRRRRMAALDLLRDARLDVLLEPAIAFGGLPDRLPRILSLGHATLAQLVRYETV